MKLRITGRVTKYHMDTINGVEVMVVDELEVDDESAANWRQALKERDPSIAKALSELTAHPKQNRYTRERPR